MPRRATEGLGAAADIVTEGAQSDCAPKRGQGKLPWWAKTQRAKDQAAPFQAFPIGPQDDGRRRKSAAAVRRRYHADALAESAAALAAVFAADRGDDALLQAVFEVADVVLSFLALPCPCSQSPPKWCSDGVVMVSPLLDCGRSGHYRDDDVTLIDMKEYFEYTPGILRAFVEPSHFKSVKPILQALSP